MNDKATYYLLLAIVLLMRFWGWDMIFRDAKFRGLRFID